MVSRKRPKVGVLLAAYNGMQWIEQQLKSIINQEGVDVTIFVSVDLSNDGTEQWVSEFSKIYPSVIMLPYGERFGGAGPNFFRLFYDVSFEGFDFIALADQDDVWLENKLIRACELISNNGFDVVSSDVIAFWSDGRRSLIKKSYPQRAYDHFFEAAGPGCTYVLNQKAAVAFKVFLNQMRGRIDSIALHDWLIYAFCRGNGFSWKIDSLPLMLYRQHADNQVGINSGYQAYRKRMGLVKDKWYRRQVNLIVEMVSPEKKFLFNRKIFLMANFNSLRRRPRDRFVLLGMFLLGFF